MGKTADSMGEEAEVPPEILFDSHCMDIAMHGQQSAVATAQITGVVSVFEYGQSGNTKMMEFTHHTDSCRAVSFSEDGHSAPPLPLANHPESLYRQRCSLDRWICPCR